MLAKEITRLAGKRLEGKYDAMMERIIREHVEAKKKDDGKRTRDLLDMLLEMYKDENSEIRLTRANIMVE